MLNDSIINYQRPYKFIHIQIYGNHNSAIELIKIKTNPSNKLLFISSQHIKFGVIQTKFQQFTNKYNLIKSKTNYNNYKIIHSYYKFL